MPVLKTPELATRRGDEEKQPFAIGQPIRLVCGSGFANFRVGQQNTTSSNTTMRGEISPPLFGCLRIHRRKKRLTGVRVPAVNRTGGGTPPERKRVKTRMDIGDEGLFL